MNRKALFFVFIVLCMHGVFAEEPFTWQLALVKDNQGILFENNSAISMRDGDSFSIELFSESDFFAYIVVRQSSGTLTPLLYRRVSANKIEKIGGTLSPPQGQLRFYVVASNSEQRELLNVIEAYNREKTSANADLLTSMLLEIRDSGDDNPGRPVDFAGSARAGDVTQGTAYSGASVYAKTITIRH